MKVYQLLNRKTGTRGTLYEADSLAAIVEQVAQMENPNELLDDEIMIILLLESTPTGEVYASQAPLVTLKSLREYVEAHG